jgi:hypothetical protein
MMWTLSWFGLGGLHRFYLGKPLSGLLYMVTFNLFFVGLLVDAFNLNDMVDAANMRGGALPPGDPRATPGLLPGPDLTHIILRTAAKRGGRITITEAVMESGRSFADVERCLDDLLKTRYCSIENHPETGAVIYRFQELEHIDRTDQG